MRYVYIIYYLILLLLFNIHFTTTIEEKRKLMHKAFLLPSNKPLLRRSAAIGEMLTKLTDNDILYNPHLSIKYKSSLCQNN